MTVFIPWFEGVSAYQVARSLRFNAADAAYLSRTPGAAGNRKVVAMRFRIKRSKLGAAMTLASAGTAGIDRFYFDSSDRLCLDVLGATRLVTAAVFRDPTAWMDVGFALDVGNATPASRAKILVFEDEVAAYGTDTRSAIADADTNWNAAVAHYLGRDDAGNYFDGHMAEPAGVDGSQAIAYSAIDPATGLRLPTQPDASWGTNGFWLPLSDNAAADATHLGADASGNGNNWTPNNFSVTAGVGNDSLVDSPTGYGSDTGTGGAVRGNYATFNPAQVRGAGDVYSDGDLSFYASQEATYGRGYATISVGSGKWYWEMIPTTGVSFMVGVAAAFHLPTAAGTVGYYADEFSYYNTGQKYNNAALAAYGASFGVGDIIGVALDLDAGTVTFNKNGTSQGVAFSGLSGRLTPIVGSAVSYFTTVANFGQRPFAYAAPAGFQALCTANLSDTTVITSGSFTGNASADGPFVWLNGVPETLTINGNAVTWGTHALKLAGGFKVITSSASYNAAGTNTFSVTSAGAPFKTARAQAN